ncbi:MAG: metallophosphoesterase, partial [Anaerolineales bacterium]
MNAHRPRSKYFGLLIVLLIAGCSRVPPLIEEAAAITSEVEIEQTSSREPTGTPQTEAVGQEATELATKVPVTPSPTSTGRFVQFDDTLAEVGFSLPITIQHISNSRAWLFFVLETPLAGEVFYWIDEREDLGVYSIQFGDESAQHLIELSDLQADTHYRVRVGFPTEAGDFVSPGLNGEMWGDILLHTYPEDLQHLRVAVIGDSGFGESITYALAAQMAAKEPDFVIHTGDVVYSAFENETPVNAYQAKYFWPFQKVLLQAPLYAVPGNHEYYSDASIGEISYYFYVFPRLQELIQDKSWVGSNQIFRNWFAVRMMGYQFLFLESQRFYRSEGTAEQNEWLRQLLTEHDGPTVGVF